MVSKKIAKFNKEAKAAKTLGKFNSKNIKNQAVKMF